MASDIDLTELRRIAKAATPRPWEAYYVAVGVSETEMRVMRYEGDWYDAAHIAAFDPPTVLALLDRLEAAEKVIADIRDALSDAPECDEHPDGDTISCGWKADVRSVCRILSSYQQKGDTL